MLGPAGPNCRASVRAAVPSIQGDLTAVCHSGFFTLILKIPILTFIFKNLKKY